MEWKEIRKCMAVVSLFIGGLAAGLPESYSKMAFAAALGLSNAAIYLNKEGDKDAAPASKKDA